MLKMEGRLLLCGVAFLAVVGMVNGMAKGAVITVSLQFTDTVGNPITSVDPSVDPNFILIAMAECTDSRGINGGTVDVTVAPDFVTFGSITVSTNLPLFQSGLTQNTPAQLDNVGGAVMMVMPPADPYPFGYATAEEMFRVTGLVDVNAPNGTVMHFTTAVGSPGFAITGAGSISDVDWGDGDLNVIPEPASLGLLTVGWIVALRRRKRRVAK